METTQDEAVEEGNADAMNYNDESSDAGLHAVPNVEVPFAVPVSGPSSSLVE